MKLLHTSDWHLGRSLFGKKRYDEFDLFLEWLIKTIQTEQVDVVVVAGDVFDTTTPSNRAQEQYYHFLVRARDAGCRHIVIVAGNHDSPSFLDAPKSLLRTMRVHVIGTATVDIADEVLVIPDDDDTPALVVCAVPYLRDRDLRRAEVGETEADRQRRVTEGIAQHYEAVLGAALKQVASNASTIEFVPVVATGHLFTAGGQTIDGDGVRDLYVGTLAHLDVAMFPARFDYVALGHLHVPQKVGGREFIRYSGSPLPMGFGEASQTKEVVLVSWDDGIRVIRSVPVPRFQRLERIGGDMDAIAWRISQLIDAHESVWMEIEYTGAALMPDLRERIAALTKDSLIEVLRLRNRRVFNQVLQAVETEEELSALDANEVFVRLLEGAEIPKEQWDELIACHGEILKQVLENDGNEA